MARGSGTRGGPAREAAAVVAEAVGFGGWERMYRGPRGPVQLAVQTVVVAVAVAVFVLVRGVLLGSGEFTPHTPAWALAAALLVLPMVVHAFLRPPRMVVGLVVGVGTAVLGGLLAWSLFGPAAWPAFAVLTVGFVAGAALFGAISPTAGLPEPAGTDEHPSA